MKILIVDGDLAVRETIKDSILIIMRELKQKWEVFEANNQIKTISLIERHQPNLVIIDIQTPEINGLEVIKYIQQEGNSVKLIVTSTFPIHQSVALAIGAGFLPKPFQFEYLKKLICDCLGIKPGQ
jgi:DNA-binding response OmpR family regulator